MSLPATKLVTGYTWIQRGITSYTGNAQVLNGLDSGVSPGAIVHRSLQRSQFHLDSGKLQQGCYGAVVHDVEHWRLVLTGQQQTPRAVFTSAQAEAGRTACQNTCGKCHTYTLLGRKGEDGELPPVDSLSAA